MYNAVDIPEQDNHEKENYFCRIRSINDDSAWQYCYTISDLNKHVNLLDSLEELKFERYMIEFYPTI